MQESLAQARRVTTLTSVPLTASRRIAGGRGAEVEREAAELLPAVVDSQQVSPTRATTTSNSSSRRRCGGPSCRWSRRFATVSTRARWYGCDQRAEI